MTAEKPLTVAQLADLLGVSTDWVYTQVEARAIPYTRLPGGRLVRFTAAQVEAILADGDEPVLTVPAISLARARAIRAAKPPSTPPPDPKTPVTPPRPAPASPRPPSGPGRLTAADGGDRDGSARLELGLSA